MIGKETPLIFVIMVTPRYAIGKLYDPSTQTILGLKPAHFVTMATPHVGCTADGVSEVPLLGWAGEMPFIGGHLHKAMSAMAAPVSSFMFGRSGMQFFLEVGPQCRHCA